MPHPPFQRTIGMDYSGAETPDASLPGLRCYESAGAEDPVEVLSPPSPRKYWTRKGLAEWLVQRLSDGVPTLVGIDHGFSFPIPYFEQYQLPHEWPAFLDDFQVHWPTDQDHTYVNFIRQGVFGNGAARSGNARWRRLTEVRAGAKSVFHFDVPGSVAKSTHAGLPWLRYLRNQLGGQLHSWPFDGWDIPSGKSAIAEVYPSLWSKAYWRADRTADQHDAWVIARQLQRFVADHSLSSYLHPALSTDEAAIARIEGWILGVLA